MLPNILHIFNKYYIFNLYYLFNICYMFNMFNYFILFYFILIKGRIEYTSIKKRPKITKSYLSMTGREMLLTTSSNAPWLHPLVHALIL
jgi:hypothetical protein